MRIQGVLSIPRCTGHQNPGKLFKITVNYLMYEEQNLMEYFETSVRPDVKRREIQLKITRAHDSTGFLTLVRYSSD